MEQTKTIYVRKKHMRKMPEGANACNECMVARALHDAGFTDATVGFVTVATSKFSAYLPPDVTDKIHDFVDGKSVEPFKFTLQLRTFYA